METGRVSPSEPIRFSQRELNVPHLGPGEVWTFTSNPQVEYIKADIWSINCLQYKKKKKGRRHEGYEKCFASFSPLASIVKGMGLFCSETNTQWIRNVGKAVKDNVVGEEYF